MNELMNNFINVSIILVFTSNYYMTLPHKDWELPNSRN